MHVHRSLRTTRATPPGAVSSSMTGPGPALLWLVAGAVLLFLVAWVGTDLLELQPDLYYLGYFTVAVAFLAVFLARNASALAPLWVLHLWQSLLVGALVGVALAGGVLAQAATPRPDGWRLGFEVLWRGVVYGCVDALTLYVFPAAVAYLLLRGNRDGPRRRVAFAVLALGLSLVVTTTYHLGYAEYRGGTLRFPEIGAVVANVPTVLTGNPLGAVLAHGSMHVTAVVHQNQGGEQHMLPPNGTADYADHGSSDLAAVLAAAWLLATGVALTVLVRRQRPPSA